MTLYNREQLVVLCCLLVLMLGMAGVRSLRPAASPPAVLPQQSHVYEIRGAVRSPGIYGFAGPRTLRFLLEAAGARETLSAGLRSGNAEVPGGSRVVVGSTVAVEAMSAQDRLNCGLRIDLNAATPGDLALIPGMGPRTAHDILEYRDRAGRIRDVHELRRVPGIGRKRFERFAAYLEAGG